MGDTVGEVVWWLVVLAALDVGLNRVLDFDLVGLLSVSWLITLVAALMGLSGLWMLVGKFKK